MQAEVSYINMKSNGSTAESTLVYIIRLLMHPCDKQNFSGSTDNVIFNVMYELIMFSRKQSQEPLHKKLNVPRYWKQLYFSYSESQLEVDSK